MCFDVSGDHMVWPSINFCVAMLSQHACSLDGWFASSFCWHVFLILLNSKLQSDDWNRLQSDFSHIKVYVISPLLEVVSHSQDGRTYDERGPQFLEGCFTYLIFISLKMSIFKVFHIDLVILYLNKWEILTWAVLPALLQKQQPQAKNL